MMSDFVVLPMSFRRVVNDVVESSLQLSALLTRDSNILFIVPTLAFIMSNMFCSFRLYTNMMLTAARHDSSRNDDTKMIILILVLK